VEGRGSTLIREWNVAADIPHFRQKIFTLVTYLFKRTSFLLAAALTRMGTTSMSVRLN
jgi:hypothetical protein